MPREMNLQIDAGAVVSTVRDMYGQGRSQSEIGRAIGASQGFVSKVMRQHGMTVRPNARNPRRGAAHPYWKGAGASYRTLHHRVEKARGKPSKCEVCGTTKAKRFEWASMSKRYDDPADYKRMCARCHKLHDGIASNLRTPAARQRKRTAESARHEVVIAAFRQHGSTTAAAAALGISRHTVNLHVKQDDPTHTRKIKFTDAQLRDAASKSSTLSGIARLLGVTPAAVKFRAKKSGVVIGG